MTKCALAILSSLLLVSPVRSALINESAEIARIPAYLTDLSTCGHRPSEGGDRYFRILHARFFRGNSLLYIQWMKQADDAPEPKVLHTLSIPEFNADDHGELNFAKPRCIETPQGIRFTIVAESGHDLKKRRFDLRVFHEIGRYRIRQVAIRP